MKESHKITFYPFQLYPVSSYIFSDTNRVSKCFIWSFRVHPGSLREQAQDKNRTMPTWAPLLAGSQQINEGRGPGFFRVDIPEFSRRGTFD